MASFSIKNSALNSGVVVTIILPFWLKETVEITGFTIPLALKALLIKLRIAKGEKSLAWTFRACRRVHLLERADLLGPLAVVTASLVVEPVHPLPVPLLLPFLATLVHSWTFWVVVESLELAFGCLAILAQVGVLLLVCWIGCFLACDSIFLVASSRLATCVARIEEVFWITPFSVYSRNISIKSSNLDCSSLELVKEQALTSKSLA